MCNDFKAAGELGNSFLEIFDTVDLVGNVDPATAKCLVRLALRSSGPINDEKQQTIPE